MCRTASALGLNSGRHRHSFFDKPATARLGLTLSYQACARQGRAVKSLRTSLTADVGLDRLEMSVDVCRDLVWSFAVRKVADAVEDDAAVAGGEVSLLVL
jgi:hypothetical protein